MARRTKLGPGSALPPVYNWATSDTDELERRQLRARTEGFVIRNRESQHRIFSTFDVSSPSGRRYAVEIRDLAGRQFACECVDFRINGLGTCKHVEAVLNLLAARFKGRKGRFPQAEREGSPRLDVVPDPGRQTLRVVGQARRPRVLDRWFDGEGLLREVDPEEAAAALEALQKSEPRLRVSLEVRPWLENRRRLQERRLLRREYELKVQAGEWPPQETLVPLFPYQREGMLHLAFAERALLADEMGLGKTIQAIAACALLHRLGLAHRVLVVTPASLKTEWEEQIQRFTELPYQLVYGGRAARLKAYEAAPFFTMVNYEQMLADSLEVNARLAPDVVILDEAQRIKNWSAKTTQAIKRLQSRYAFVLTGTPIENRIDELHSLMDFLDPGALGPLFRFNREYYQLDERGRPAGYCNLDKLHERISPYLLRRRKAEVETELPARTDENRFVPLSPAQRTEYEGCEEVVARLASAARRRPLTQQEQERMLRYLGMMRMLCDTTYILDAADRTCPKLAELEKILEDCVANDAKVIVFSEWERMLELVRDLCGRLGLGFAWHTGSVPQKRRRAEINLFKGDPACRVFLSTDSGAAGLNLQNASVVVNCDLPWNPAKLEQRIARAWRKHQTRPVMVINLVTEASIEERMLGTLGDKRTLADGVLDRVGNLNEIKLRSGRQAFMARLEQILGAGGSRPAVPAPARPRMLPADRPAGFAAEAAACLGGAMVRCEERFPGEGAHSVLYVVVEHNAAQHRAALAALHDEYFGPGRSDPLAPVQLEVLDRATDEALQRLMAAGLVATTTRAARCLLSAGPEAAPAPLSAAERQKLAEARAQAARKLKMAALLGEGGLEAEALAALREALVPIGAALAAEARLPEPGSAEDAVRPPLASCWGGAHGSAVAVARDPAVDWRGALASLQSALGAAGAGGV